MTDFAVRKAFSEFARDDAQSNRKAIAVELTAVVLLGFVLRYFLLTQGSIVNGDGIFYIWRAQKLMAGDLWNGISAYWSPLYSLLTGLIGYPIQDFEAGGRIVSLLAGTLLIPATYYLGALLFDRPTGAVGSLLVATHAPLVHASTWVMTEAVYGLLFLGMITTGWLALRENNLWYWALTGLLIGLAYLTKPEALAFMSLFLLFAVVAAFVDRRNSRRLFLGVAIMSCIAAACSAPYVLFLHSKVGEWTLSKKTSTNTMSGVNEDAQLIITNGGRQTMIDQLWGDEYLPKLDDDSSTAVEGASPTLVTKFGWAYQLLRRQVYDFLPALVSFGFLPLIAIGLFASPWTRSEATRNLYLGAFFVATLIGYSFAVTNIRYLLAVIPLLLIWTGYGAIVLARWLSDSIRQISAGSLSLPNSLSQALIVVALLLLATPSLIAKFAPQDRTGTPLEEQQAGLWLRSRIGEGPATVMASHANVAYYAGAQHLFLPDEDMSTIIEYAKRRKANFLVFNSRRFVSKKRRFAEIPPEQTPDVELVYSSAPSEPFQVRIFKLRP